MNKQSIFLDDKLYEAAKSVNYKHWSDKTTIQNLWTSIVVNHICDESEKMAKDQSSSDYDVYIIIKRCKTHWNNTLKKLEKEGIELFEEDSFESFVKKHPLFDGFREQTLKFIR